MRTLRLLILTIMIYNIVIQLLVGDKFSPASLACVTLFSVSVTLIITGDKK